MSFQEIKIQKYAFDVFQLLTHLFHNFEFYSYRIDIDVEFFLKPKYKKNKKLNDQNREQNREGAKMKNKRNEGSQEYSQDKLRIKDKKNKNVVVQRAINKSEQ